MIFNYLLLPKPDAVKREGAAQTWNRFILGICGVCCPFQLTRSQCRTYSAQTVAALIRKQLISSMGVIHAAARISALVLCSLAF